MKKNYLIALKSILHKEIHRFMRIWLQTLVPPVINIGLYFVIFGSLIGPRVGTMSGFDYMTFIVPGLIMMSIITNSYSNVASSFFSTKWQRDIEEMLVAPVPTWVIVIGYVSGGMARGILVGSIVTLISLFFVDLRIYNFWILSLTLFLTSAAAALGGLINAIFAKSFDGISIIPTFVLTPLTYLSGVFYSIDLLSEFCQEVSRLNPIVYIINAFRYGFLGISDLSITVAFTIIVTFVVALYIIAIYLISKGIGLRS